MIRYSNYGLWAGLVFLLVGCGQADEESLGGRCEIEPQRVMLAISAALPSLLETERCEPSEELGLEAFLLLPDESSCFVDLDIDGVEGCCPVSNLNRTLAATLVVRTPGLEALFESTRLVEIPSSAQVEVAVDFDSDSFSGGMYDSDRDGSSNIDEYCAGTL
jgi:hypothetical protein